MADTDALIKQALKEEEAERKRSKQEKAAQGAPRGAQAAARCPSLPAAAAVSRVACPTNGAPCLPPAATVTVAARLPSVRAAAAKQAKVARKGKTLEQIEDEEGGPVKESQVSLERLSCCLPCCTCLCREGRRAGPSRRARSAAAALLQDLRRHICC